VHVVDCKKATTAGGGPLKYVRTGNLIPNEDKRLYDYGTFNIATVGMDVLSTGVIGELWIAYQVEFFKPKFVGAMGTTLRTDHYSYRLDAIGSVDSDGPFGMDSNNLYPNGVNGVGTYLSSVDGLVGRGRLNFGPEHQGMYFMVQLNYHGVVGTANLPRFEVSTDSNISNVAWFKNFTSSSLRSTATITAESIYMNHIITVDRHHDGPWYQNYLLSSDGTLNDANSTLDVFVMQINGTPEPITV